jgi:hypothetical protein
VKRPNATAVAIGASLVAVVLAVAVALAAGASPPPPRALVEDPNDVRGVMDVRRVWLDPAAEPPEWTVVTLTRWTLPQIRDHGFVFVYLDTKGGPAADYYAMVRSIGRRLVSELFRVRSQGFAVPVRPLEARHPSPLRLNVGIPVGSLSFGGLRTSYRWWVATTFTGRVCRATCVDHVPDEGGVEQPLGSPSPTVTPTPTATSSPTP